MGTILFDFSNHRDIEAWVPFNDVVMGGVSNGRLEATGDGTAAFTGIVSLERGGGFASVRSRPHLYDLSRCSGLELRLRSDGRRYKANLRTDAGEGGFLYASMIETQAGEWRTVFLPFEEFRPTFRGRVVPEASALDLSRVTSVGLMISDRQAGPFLLELAMIQGLTRFL